MLTTKQRERERTIKYVLPNLRGRWPALSNIEDDTLAALYEDFYFSEDAGNNDARFPEWCLQYLDINVEA